MVNVLDTQRATVESVESTTLEVKPAPNLKAKSPPEDPGFFTKMGRRFALATALSVPVVAAEMTPQSHAAPAPKPYVEKLDIMPRQLPPATMEAWLAEHPEYEQTTINRVADELAHKEFRVRERASNLLLKKLQDLEKQANPAPVGIAQYRTAKMLNKTLDPEADQRSSVIDKKLDLKNKTTRIPPIRTTAPEIIKMLEGKHHGVVLDLSPEGQARLAETMITIDKEANAFWQVLDQVRGAADLRLRFDATGRAVLTDKATPELALMAQSNTLALFRQGDATSSHLLIAEEPGKGLVVCIDNAKIIAGPAHTATVSAASCPPTRLMQYNVVAPPCIANAKLENLGAWNTDHATVSATIVRAKDPFSGTIEAKAGVSFKHSSQSITVISIEENKDGTCTVVLQIGVYQQIPWPPTKYDWDKKTYANGVMTRTDFLGEDGSRISMKRIKMKANERLMTATYTLPSKPKMLAVQGFGEIEDPQEVNFGFSADKLPNSGPPNFLGIPQN